MQRLRNIVKIRSKFSAGSYFQASFAPTVSFVGCSSKVSRIRLYYVWLFLLLEFFSFFVGSYQVEFSKWFPEFTEILLLSFFCTINIHYLLVLQSWRKPSLHIWQQHRKWSATPIIYCKYIYVTFRGILNSTLR